DANSPAPLFKDSRSRASSRSAERLLGTDGPPRLSSANLPQARLTGISFRACRSPPNEYGAHRQFFRISFLTRRVTPPTPDGDVARGACPPRRDRSRPPGGTPGRLQAAAREARGAGRTLPALGAGAGAQARAVGPDQRLP